jgi:hypothetical protein
MGDISCPRALSGAFVTGDQPKYVYIIGYLGRNDETLRISN